MAQTGVDPADKKTKKVKKLKPSKPGLPQRLQDQHDYVTCGLDLNSHTTVPISANCYLTCGVDNAWDPEEFRERFDIQIHSLGGPSAALSGTGTWDVMGLDPSVMNALRRILLAEVPTMAIENVFIRNNTSIMPDEMLAHRLGLVPIRADPSIFTTKTAEESGNEKNVIVFKLSVRCRWKPGSNDKEMENETVTSSMLEWLPNGSEMPEETNTRFAGDQQQLLPEGAAPVHDDILLMRLRPGQVIDLEAHCTKGVGVEHAKWSPVATAWYRLLPQLRLTKPVSGQEAQQLANALPGLVTLEQHGSTAVVGEAREHDHLLEKARRLAGEDFAGVLEYRKRKEHYILTIESTGILSPERLFTEAVDVLAAKCDRLLSQL